MRLAATVEGHGVRFAVFSGVADTVELVGRSLALLTR